jgi:NAD(P)-dependent dehydrogenase (short-subunit alcohol dehydrogenase family)
MNLNDKTPAIVTGGGSGLGAATARRLAAAGAKVAVLDLNEEAANKVADEIRGIAVVCNVTDPASVTAAIAAAARAHGPARIAVNCAGIAHGERTIGKDAAHDLDKFRKVIEINLIGTFNVLRLAAFEMAKLDAQDEGERGVIINTASVAAYDGQIGQVAYGASKGGVASLTLPAARDLSRNGIRVVTIAPGLFMTPMMAGLPKDVQDSLGSATPFPARLGRPEEYAELALHICQNAMLNGETIRLDGAIRLAPK